MVSSDMEMQRHSDYQRQMEYYSQQSRSWTQVAIEALPSKDFGNCTEKHFIRSQDALRHAAHYLALAEDAEKLAKLFEASAPLIEGRSPVDDARDYYDKGDEMYRTTRDLWARDLEFRTKPWYTWFGGSKVRPQHGEMIP